MITFNNLIINTLFARNYHIKMLAAFLESFRLWFDSPVTVQHSKQAVLCVAAWQ